MTGLALRSPAVVAILATAMVTGFPGKGPSYLRGVGDGDDPPYGRSLLEAAGVAHEWGPGLEALKASVRARGRGQYRQALDEAARGWGTLPGLRDWAAFVAAQAAAEAGDSSEVELWLERAGTDLSRRWGWRTRVRALERAGKVVPAARSAARTARALGTEHVAALAWRTAGDLWLRSGDRAQAVGAYERAIEVDATSRAALRAAEALRTLSDVGASARLASARTLVVHRQANPAADELARYSRSAASDPEHASALRVEIGRLLFVSRRYPEVEKLLGREPGSDAALLVARSRYRQGKRDAAAADLRRLAERFPFTDAAGEAEFILGDLRHDSGDVDGAAAHYQAAWEAAPGSQAGSEALIRLMGLAYGAGELAGSANRLASALPHLTGAQAQRIAYWAARGHAEVGDSTGAAALLDLAASGDATSLYAMRAAETRAPGSWHELLGDSPEADAADVLEARGGLARLDALRTLGLNESEEFEHDRLTEHLARSPGGLYALAELYHDRGRTLEGILTGRRIHRIEQQWNPRLLRLVFPFPHREAIERAAARHGLDPFLVAAIVRQESTFNPSAKSPAGAVGLLQVMPSTARGLARRAGARNGGKLTDPDVNLALGTLHLSDLLRRYGGRLEEALAAYNAGSTPVATWQSFPERKDREVFAERIPFPETREYVRVVQQNARIYAELYRNEEGISGNP